MIRRYIVKVPKFTLINWLILFLKYGHFLFNDLRCSLLSIFKHQQFYTTWTIKKDDVCNTLQLFFKSRPIYLGQDPIERFFLPIDHLITRDEAQKDTPAPHDFAVLQNIRDIGVKKNINTRCLSFPTFSINQASIFNVHS